MRAIIIAIAAAIVLLAAGLGFVVISSLDDDDVELGRPEGGFNGDVGSGTAVDSAARIEIEFLRQQVEEMREEIATLESRLQTVESRPAASPGFAPPVFGNQPPSNDAPENVGPNAIKDAYAQVVLIANRRKVNGDINVAGPRFLENFLGRPRANLSDNCDSMTNPKLRAMLKTESVGPIRVTMLQPAMDSIRRVFDNVKATDPDLYDRISTAGSLCVRQIRGTRGRTSTHSFGLAVDLNIDGKLDTLGDGKTQLGLTILADFFRAEGWAWGAAFSREDSMHFEVSRQQLEQWRSEGKI